MPVAPVTNFRYEPKCKNSIYIDNSRHDVLKMCLPILHFTLIRIFRCEPAILENKDSKILIEILGLHQFSRKYFEIKPHQ